MTPGPEALPAVLVEAFASGPCTGNGAAVVLLKQPMQATRMQALARSLRQSETAFLLESPQGWLLRWFTPSCEVPLCGHATLAALLALGHWGRLSAGERLGLHSRSGVLEVGLDPVRAGWGSLVLPSSPLQPSQAPPLLLDLLERHQLGPLLGFWGSALGYSVALLESQAPLATLPCPAAELDGDLGRGLVLMQSLADETIALEGEPADYQLRFFAPGLGIDEDPVTGSAHALVAPWWQERLGRARVVGWQCSDRPGGMVCEVAPSGMIRLFGSGHLLWDGTLRTASASGSRPAVGASPPAPLNSGDPWSEWLTATHCG